MPLGKHLLGKTWLELRRRKVVRSAGAYAVFAFVVLQLAEITFEPLGLPAWAMTWTVLAAILGFPIVLVLAWFFDVTDHGIARDVTRGGATGAAFAVALVLLTVGGVGFWLSTVYTPRDQAASEPAGRVTRHASSAPAEAIAVLPFDDMSPHGDQRHVADGIAEELLDRLARMQGLKVAARTSSFALRDFAGDMREIGRLLNVRWVLEGSVRKTAGKIRVTAQLIDAEDGYHAWSETYERPDQDLFALQDEVTEAIAGQLAQRIVGVGGTTDGAISTQNPQALELYLQGRQAWRQRSTASLKQAVTLFEQALALDPAFAHASSGLADAYLLQADYGVMPLNEAIARAEPAAVRAVSTRPDLADAWASIGLLRMLAGQLDPARRSLEEAVRIDPRNEMALMWLANVYGRQGQLARQREVLQQAAELSPLEPVINFNLASLLVESGESAEARARINRALAVRPDDAMLLRSLSSIELATGQLATALELARRAHAVEPENVASLTTLLFTHATLLDFGPATRLIEQLRVDPLKKALAAQHLRLRQGDTRLLPELSAHVAELIETGSSLTPPDREALALAGQVELFAGNFDRAATLLGRVVASPEQLQSDVSLIDPASQLTLALRESGATEQAERWQQVVSDSAREWLARAEGSSGWQFGRALQAVHDDDPVAAMQRLRLAVDSGFRELWLLRGDPRLAPLRRLPDWPALQQRVADAIAAERRAAGIDTA